MREGWARGTWGRVQPLSGTFCCSRVQLRAAACRDHMHGSCLSNLTFECSHVLLKESLGAALSLCSRCAGVPSDPQSEPSTLRPLLNVTGLGSCNCGLFLSGPAAARACGVCASRCICAARWGDGAPHCENRFVKLEPGRAGQPAEVALPQAWLDETNVAVHMVCRYHAMPAQLTSPSAQTARMC